MRVRYTKLAHDHLRELRRVSQSRFGAATATSTMRRIDSAISDLVLFPERGRQGRVAGTRELIMTGTPFVIAYRITDRDVQILAVLHAARRWPVSFQ